LSAEQQHEKRRSQPERLQKKEFEKRGGTLDPMSGVVIGPGKRHFPLGRDGKNRARREGRPERQILQVGVFYERKTTLQKEPGGAEGGRTNTPRNIVSYASDQPVKGRVYGGMKEKGMVLNRAGWVPLWLYGYQPQW